jgi:hypothetical protein
LAVLTPKPSPVPLVRIGGDRDGAYLVPSDLDGVKACFSPGVSTTKLFEDEMVERYAIRCHLCDFSSDVERLTTPLIAGWQTFDKKWLDVDGGPESISLQEWIDVYAPDPGDDLLLQMDVEAAEYRNLNQASTETLQRFRVIVIELHNLDLMMDDQQREVDLAPLLRKLDATHVCVHAHPNNCCGDVIDPESGRNIPRVLELSLLRRDRLAPQGQTDQGFPPALPHPLDIPRNVLALPPLALNTNWPGAATSGPSGLKRVQDELAYVNFMWNADKPLLDNHRRSQDVLQAAIENLYRSTTGDLRGSGVDPAPSGRLDWVDLARGKPFILSDSFAGLPREGVVQDGEPFFFHTAIACDQSITIDLQQSCSWQELVLKNRSDGWQERAQHLFWCVHEANPFQGEPLFPVLGSDSFLNSPDGLSTTPLLGRKGRYLTLYSPALTAIHLSSIRVYGRR